ncbi:MAG: hypothetical protein FD143_3340 [Ignavibacteria bacterium]|nr:MAG: hypothetical protein FD143_3340 [Ignavibacteria bacterium]
MDKALQALRLMQYGQGFGGAWRGMYRQVTPIQTTQVEAAPVAVPEDDQIGEGRKRRKRKRVYKGPAHPRKKKAKRRKGTKKGSRKSKIKRFQVPIPPYNF